MELLFFSLQSSADYGDRICSVLGITRSAHEERSFADGENKIRSLVNVRNRDIFVLGSLYSDAESTNDKLCKLLFFIGALRDAAAASVTAVVPYLCYARKDRKTQPRDPVTTRYVASLFDAVGTDRIVTIDVHNLMAYQNAFRARTDHLEATNLFVDHFARVVGGTKTVVISPDAGGVARAERFRHALEKRLSRSIGSAFVEKHRAGGAVSGGALVGDVNGCTAIVIDDMIATGGTLVRAARAARAHGAANVYAAATHGLFIGADSILGDSALDHVVVTDTISPFRLPPGAIGSRVFVLESATLLAEAIRRIHEGGSLVDLLEPRDATEAASTCSNSLVSLRT